MQVESVQLPVGQQAAPLSTADEDFDDFEGVLERLEVELMQLSDNAQRLGRARRELAELQVRRLPAADMEEQSRQAVERPHGRLGR
jgi:hypothetical protein